MDKSGKERGPKERKKTAGAERGGKAEMGFLLAAAFLAALCAFFLRHYDGEAITRWGYDLLECVKNGTTSAFPQYTFENFGSPTNYSLFVNAVTALWLSPLYLLNQAAGLSLPMTAYEEWYKVLVCAAIFADLLVFNRILRRMEYDRSSRMQMLALFLANGITLLATLGKGQIDAYGLLFLLLGVLLLTERKYIGMALLFGMALLVKPNVLLLAVPLFLLLMKRWGGRIFLYGGIALVPYICDKAVTALWMPQYLPLSRKTFELLKEAFGGLTITEQIFDLQINQVLCFGAAALILCFCCYYLGGHGKAEAIHFYALPPLLLASFGILVCASYQWFLYLLPALLMMGMQYQKRRDFYLLFLGMNLGLVIYFAAAESMRLLTGTVLQYTGMYQSYLLSIGKTLFYVCMVLMIAVFYLEQRNLSMKKAERENECDKRADKKK